MQLLVVLKVQSGLTKTLNRCQENQEDDLCSKSSRRQTLVSSLMWEPALIQTCSEISTQSFKERLIQSTRLLKCLTPKEKKLNDLYLSKSLLTVLISSKSQILVDSTMPRKMPAQRSNSLALWPVKNGNLKVFRLTDPSGSKTSTQSIIDSNRCQRNQTRDLHTTSTTGQLSRAVCFPRSSLYQAPQEAYPAENQKRKKWLSMTYLMTS